MAEIQFALADFQSDSVLEVASDYPNLKVTLSADWKVVTVKGDVETAFAFIARFPALAGE